MTDLQKANDFFSKDIYATQTTGIIIEQVDENYAKCYFDIDTKHLNAGNVVMGGAIFTLADFAFAVASNFNNSMTVSLSSQITYLNVAKGNRLIAEAKCIKSGKSTCCFNISINDDIGTEVAIVIITGFRR